MQTWDCKITPAKWFFISLCIVLLLLSSLLLCPIPLWVSVFRSCLWGTEEWRWQLRMPAAATAAAVLVTFILSILDCRALRRAGPRGIVVIRSLGDRAWWSSSMQTNPPEKTFSLCLTLPISWDSQILEFSWSTAAIIAVADCSRDCKARVPIFSG